MRELEYEGKPCIRGHVNENGMSMRSKANNRCLQCQRDSQQARRNNDPNYANYQKQYHAKLRKEDPERLSRYQTTQIERGRGFVKKADRDTFVPVVPELYERKKYE